MCHISTHYNMQLLSYCWTATKKQQTCGSSHSGLCFGSRFLWPIFSFHMFWFSLFQCIDRVLIECCCCIDMLVLESIGRKWSGIQNGIIKWANCFLFYFHFFFFHSFVCVTMKVCCGKWIEKLKVTGACHLCVTSTFNDAWNDSKFSLSLEELWMSGCARVSIFKWDEWASETEGEWPKRNVGQLAITIAIQVLCRSSDFKSINFSIQFDTHSIHPDKTKHIALNDNTHTLSCTASVIV